MDVKSANIIANLSLVYIYIYSIDFILRAIEMRKIIK